MRLAQRARRLFLWGSAVLGVLAGTGLGVGCALSGPAWRGPVTDHFDGTKFYSAGGPHLRPGFSEMLKWQGERRPGPWREAREVAPGPPPPREVGPGRLRVTFINHATTLLQLDGVNVLTDPIYSERCSPTQLAGPKRVRPPGIRFEDLPRIDAVVLSHNHYDHMDVPTLKRLIAAFPSARIFTGLGNKALLEAKGVAPVEEFDWWQSAVVKGVTLRSVPSQHFSNRGLFDSDATVWTSWSIEGAGGRTYFAGDTGYGPQFRLAAERLGPFRLAVLPIGAYRPEWFMGPIHMSPMEAVKAALELRATLAVPMHYGTFPLADDGELEPVEALREAVKQTPAPFRVLEFGEGVDVPEVGGP